MTKLLEKAIDEVRKLPDTDQDAMAGLILEELKAERRWDEAFAKSQNQLERLADEALKEAQAGRVSPMQF